MQSTDHEILISINNEIHKINTRLEKVEQDIAEIRTEQIVMKEDIAYLKNEVSNVKIRVEDLQTSVYWIFAGITIIVSLLSLVPQLTRKKETERPAPQPNIIFTDIVNLKDEMKKQAQGS